MEMPTGKTIQTLRRQKGLTQEQLAEAVGVTAAAVSKWETANAYPDILLLCLWRGRWAPHPTYCWIFVLFFPRKN